MPCHWTCRRRPEDSLERRARLPTREISMARLFGRKSRRMAQSCVSGAVSTTFPQWFETHVDELGADTSCHQAQSRTLVSGWKSGTRRQWSDVVVVDSQARCPRRHAGLA